MKMIELSEDHYIVVDDTEIKKGDWIGFSNLEKFVPVQYLGGDLTGYEKRITHSTQPIEFGWGQEGRDFVSKKVYNKVKPLSLSEVKELLGEVDVEKKAFELAILFHNTYEKLAPAFGYETRLDTKVFDKNSANGKLMIAVCKEIYQALEDNKDKVSLKDLKRFLGEGRYKISKDAGGNITADFTELMSLLTSPKTEWDVEFSNGKLKLV